MRIKEISPPCVAAVLVCFPGSSKGLDNLIRGNNAEWRGGLSGCATGEVSGR